MVAPCCSILVLHGKHQTGEIFRQRIKRTLKHVERRLRDEGVEDVRFYFPDGEFELALRDGDQVPTRSWYRSDSPQDIPRFLRRLEAYCTQEGIGSIDMVFGFSQGAILASLLLSLDVAKDAPALATMLASVKLAVLAGTPYQRFPRSAVTSMPGGVFAPHTPVATPTLHYVSKEDALTTANAKEQTLEFFHDAVVVEHGQGHVFPTKEAQTAPLLGTISARVLPALVPAADDAAKPQMSAFTITDEQQDELESLVDIYGDDVQVMSRTPPLVMIRLSVRDVTGTMAAAFLNIVFSQAYPDTAPEISTSHLEDVFGGKTASPTLLNALAVEHLAAIAEENLGMVMCVTLVMAFEEWIDEKVTAAMGGTFTIPTRAMETGPRTGCAEQPLHMRNANPTLTATSAEMKDTQGVSPKVAEQESLHRSRKAAIARMLAAIEDDDDDDDDGNDDVKGEENSVSGDATSMRLTRESASQDTSQYKRVDDTSNDTENISDGTKSALLNVLPESTEPYAPRKKKVKQSSLEIQQLHSSIQVAFRAPYQQARSGLWKYTVGLVGKPSAGKSTFFNAISDPRTDAETAKVASYPFTTIDPNVGQGYFTVESPAVALGLADKDGAAARNKVPIILKDVAGLVPGAYKGRGKGNAFLNDLCDADVLIHIVDGSGRSDENGVVLEHAINDPVNDVMWIKEELHRWIFNNVASKWAKCLRSVDNFVSMFTGYQARKDLVYEAISRAGHSLRELEKKMLSWGPTELHTVIAHFLHIRFPIMIALNKVDKTPPERVADVVARLKEKGNVAVPMCAKMEWTLCRLRNKGAIRYTTGASSVDVIVHKPSDSKSHDASHGNNAQLHQRAITMKRNLEALHAYPELKGTGALDVMNRAVLELCPPLLLYPVLDFSSFRPLALHEQDAKEASTAKIEARNLNTGTLSDGCSTTPPLSPSVGTHQQNPQCAQGEDNGATTEVAADEATAYSGPLCECILVYPRTTAGDLYELLNKAPMNALHGEYVRCDCFDVASRQQKVVRRADVLTRETAILRILTNKRKGWQKQAKAATTS